MSLAEYTAFLKDPRQKAAWCLTKIQYPSAQDP
jgi:hypothetical protein